ncbi:MAG: hypothetical protein GX619_03520, partial [Bacteroidales bacterium]|nr:hypothetical protein [Bacteroidales bacterium]NLT04152.1 hypothetical protein [Bacteroidales bacterium]
MTHNIDHYVAPLVEGLGKVLFWDPFAAMGMNLGAPVPFIVVWLIAGGLFFTLY